MWAGGFDFASLRLSPAVKQRQELPTPNKNEGKATSPTKPLCELPVTVPSVTPKKAAPVAHDMTTDEFAESDVSKLSCRFCEATTSQKTKETCNAGDSRRFCRRQQPMRGDKEESSAHTGLVCGRLGGFTAECSKAPVEQ